MSRYPEHEYKVMLGVYAGVIAAFAAFAIVDYAVQKHSEFDQGQCIVVKNTERWENPTIYKVLEVGMNKYRLRSKVENDGKYSIYYTGDNPVVTFEESYPEIRDIDNKMESAECPQEL